MQNFGRQIQGADVALFYYAGHGVQVRGSNYLVPVNANPTREADVDFQMVDVNLVLRQMQGSGTRLNLVILDACRNNPFGARGLRSSDGGLAQMRAPEGTLISYATQPGNVAQDGGDGHSPYTRALAATHPAGRARHLPDLQPGRSCGEAATGGCAAAMGVVLADRRHVLFRPAARSATPAGRRRAAAQQPLADTLRADPDRVPIKDAALLRELSERLYEHNFDPHAPDGKNSMKLAISKFQQKSSMTPTGEADRRRAEAVAQDGRSETLGIDRLWSRQRQMGDFLELPLAQGGGRRCALQLRRRQMPDRTELLRPHCGAFAISEKSWSLVQRETVQKARDSPRLTSAARLANLAALSARSVPTAPAAERSAFETQAH